MFIRQLYTGCLSEAAYYIESNGEAAVIDPLRDIDEYLELAIERNAKIKAHTMTLSGIPVNSLYPYLSSQI